MTFLCEIYIAWATQQYKSSYNKHTRGNTLTLAHCRRPIIDRSLILRSTKGKALKCGNKKEQIRDTSALPGHVLLSHDPRIRMYTPTYLLRRTQSRRDRSELLAIATITKANSRNCGNYSDLQTPSTVSRRVTPESGSSRYDQVSPRGNVPRYVATAPTRRPRQLRHGC